MKYTISDASSEERIAVVERSDSASGPSWNIQCSGANAKTIALGQVRVTLTDSRVEVFTADGARVSYPILSQSSDGTLVVATPLGNLRFVVTRGEPLGGAAGKRAGAKVVKSSMPGKVLKVFCKQGDVVEAGTPLFIIEAMKMENEIRATQSGRVEHVSVAVGQKVETGEVLVKFEAGE